MLGVPDYCRSIAAAWESVDHIKKEMKGSLLWQFKLQCSDRTWRCGMFEVEEVESEIAAKAIWAPSWLTKF